MSELPQFLKSSQKDWTNRHLNFTQKIEGLYDLQNANGGSLIDDYNAMTTGVQDFIRQAIQDGVSVRALGSGWSLNRIAATDGRMLNTKSLNMIFNITDSSVSPDYSGSRGHLLFAQCGVSIQELNQYLEKKRQCLCTSGASNGQTIAGALSTGTHGAAFDFGSIPEYVVGLHLITGPNRHVWLERASDPVASAQLVQRLGADLIRDDALFNAALVSFGSFGFIHGVMIKTEDLYLLESNRERLPFDEPMRRLQETLVFDKTGVKFHNGDERPFHFQVTLNPYDLDKGVFVNIKYKRPYPDEPRGFWDNFGLGDDAPGFIGKLGDVLPALVPFTVTTLLNTQYQPFKNKVAPPGDTFPSSTTLGKVIGAAVGIPLSAVRPVTDLLLEMNRAEGPFNGVFAFRYVKPTTATLGFTKFSPVTCIMEMDGVQSKRNLEFCEKVWTALDQQQIPYAFHWGKNSVLTPERLQNSYGDDVAAWKAARRRLLDPQSIAVFTNPQITEWGLGDDEVPAAATTA